MEWAFLQLQGPDEPLNLHKFWQINSKNKNKQLELSTF